MFFDNKKIVKKIVNKPGYWLALLSFYLTFIARILGSPRIGLKYNPIL